MATRSSRVRLTTDNACHRPLPNGEAVEALIEVAADGPAALAAWQKAGGDLSVAAGVARDITAFHALARAGSGSSSRRGRADRRALTVLLEAGADPTRANRSGETGFHRAVMLGLVWMVEEYQRLGFALWDMKDNRGLTPLEACRDHGTSGGKEALETMRRLRSASRQAALDALLPSGVSPGAPAPRF